MADHESNVCPEHGSAHDIGTDYLRAFVDRYMTPDPCKGCLAAAKSELDRVARERLIDINIECDL